MPLMPSLIRLLAALSVAASIHAQSALVLGGRVYEDRSALAVRPNFTPAPSVTVKLYRDGGDRAVSASDAAVAAVKTDASGAYSFRGLTAGDYWVAVDSRTIAASPAWPEQTFGPSGSQCARPDGSTAEMPFEGSCFGGRSLASDDASSLATSEHVALVSLLAPASGVDFAFSVNAVVTTADGAAIQGSLRQFITNANSSTGPNRMRFVPLERAPPRGDSPMGVPPRWWSIILGAALPELRDGDTTIDGTAYNFLSPATVANVNPGRLGEPATIREEEHAVSRLELPELDVTLTGAEGIVCTAPCGIRAVALHGAPATVVARADARVEHVMIGTAPDGAPAPSMGDVGLQVEEGVTSALDVLVTRQSRAGILVGPKGRLEAERLNVSQCGDPQTGGGVILLSDGSIIRSSTIVSNPGAGVLIGSPDGAAPANGNTIDGSTISSNRSGVLLGAGSSRNVITRNDLMWNGLGGVASGPFEKTPPRQNRFSANRYDENGLRPIVLNLDARDPNELAHGSDACTPQPAAPNSGISAPLIESVSVLSATGSAAATIRGRACPGVIVEVYQSYVSGLGRTRPDPARVRGDNGARETVTGQRDSRFPSIGEFNYVGAATAGPDGFFEGTFPLPAVRPMSRRNTRNEGEPQVWAAEVLRATDLGDTAFAGIAIDAQGNTSEMSVRRRVD